MDYPHKEAVVCGHRRLSYEDMEEASARLAYFLISLGVSRGDRIGIFSNKSIEEIIAIFAVLKTGGIFVHINPQYRESQLSHVISDCNLKILFIDNIKAKILEKAYTEKVPVDIIISLSPEINLSWRSFKKIYYLDDILKESTPDKIPCSNPGENDTASIIYTSGSTGMPKGIIVTHSIFYDSTVASVSVLENNFNDRLISVTPFSFDGALSQLFTSFFSGATLVLQQSNLPGDIVRTLLSESITGFHAVPSLWIMLLQKYSPFAKHSYPNLRYISTIGEVFPENYLIKLKHILKETKFYMMYGTTEAFRSTYLPPEDFERKRPSVGRPFPGVEILIVDEEGNICGPGETGEIVHRGRFVSPGYWNNREKTVGTFKGNAVYTGDSGKVDDEGYLYFLGRKDGMIKTSGYRVSPEEIEECIYQIEDIKEVVVTGIPDKETGSKIKAVAVCTNGTVLAPVDIINHCKDRLPYYMVPRIVEFREKLPRTATNKINRSAV